MTIAPMQLSSHFCCRPFSRTSAAATQFPFSGVLSISIAGLPPVLVPGAGVATLNPNTNGLHLQSALLPAGAFARTGFSASVSAASAFPIAGVQVTAANASGVLARDGSGALGGTMAIAGVAKVCLFAACASSPPANVSVPVSVVGQGGTATAIGAVNVTVRGAPWTTGTASGSAAGPGGLASSTAQAGGHLALTTPIFISTNIGALAEIAASGRIELTFEQPPPFCEVGVNQAAYVDGEALVLTRVRFANPGSAAVNGHVRLEFVVPVDAGLVVPALDSDVTLAPGLDVDVAPVTAFVVDASQPRGDYQLRCRISDPSGAPLAEGVARFRFD